MNKNLLEYEIRSHGYTIKDVCNMLNMSYSAYHRKVRGISQFTQKEIQALINLLDLKDINSIFFNQ